ncbi:MAG: VPS10 domain-containing protein [Betaproteobacteria bacterium]
MARALRQPCRSAWAPERNRSPTDKIGALRPSLREHAMRFGQHAVLFALAAAAAAYAPQAATQAQGGGTVPSALYAGLRWREIGPFRGGRVEAVTGVPGQIDTYYLGAVVGGVWKTTDGGHAWTPLFQHEAVSSIGAIAVAPSDPNIVYVGTGESAPREDISFGNGVYKSTDAGKTWTHLGLPDSRHIAKVLVDPSNPDVVLVAALGHVYGPNAERGVFRSTDGGATWQKVLYKDDQTGAIDLASSADAPRTVYAALWQLRRTPWNLSSGGPGSGIYKSTDGGATWTGLTGGGLPGSVLGKIGLAVVPGTNGQHVYALIEADHGGLYRSDDGGATWRLVNAEHVLWSRAWYFTKVWVHPSDPDTLFIAGNSFWKSTDAGATFKRVTLPGGDNHDLWINPRAPERMIEANDQGVVLTVNAGQTWDKRNNLPIGQFYHVSTDREFPYNIYGAQQDMGALTIASRGWGGITDRDWFNIGGDDGECGYVWPDPLNSRYVIAGGYGGALTVFDKRSHQLRDIAPWSNANGGYPASELKYRFTWTSPVAFSPTSPHVLYMGSQYLMESRNGGTSWKVISPDLTRNDKSKQGLSGGPITKDNASVEYYDVIFAIAPSPLQPGRIWVGTDDGLVQLTTDDGAGWKKVTPPDLPEWEKVSIIEASHFDPQTAYVAVDGHKMDDFAPHIYRTRDGGRTWTTIVNGISAPAFVYAVREDPKRRGLLYAGTETGIYVSFDAGDHWQSLQLNLPTTSVRDIAVHDDDLIVATHGRSFWVLDGIGALRQADAALAAAPAHLFTPRTALRIHEAGSYSIPAGSAGANPPNGAIIDYYIGARTGRVAIEIHDAQGRLAFSLSSERPQATEAPELPFDQASGGEHLSTDPGMHRLVWDLRYPLPPLIPGTAYDERSPRGVLAVPGTYKITLTADDHTQTTTLTVRNDPRSLATQPAMIAEFTLASHLMQMLGDLHATVRDIRAKMPALDAAGQREAAAILDQLYESQAKANIDLLNYPMRLNARIAYLEDEVDFGDGAPTVQFREMSALYQQQLDRLLRRWRALKDR